MSERAEQLESIEISIEQARKSIKRMQQLEKLEKNSAFKELILEGFLEKHAVRQVQLRAHPSLQDEKTQKLLNDQITAIGHFKQFLINVYAEGKNAEQALAADEATREELLAEDLD